MRIRKPQFFGKLMSRDRAYLLMTFFDLSNNAEHLRLGQPGHKSVSHL